LQQKFGEEWMKRRRSWRRTRYRDQKKTMMKTKVMMAKDLLVDTVAMRSAGAYALRIEICWREQMPKLGALEVKRELARWSRAL
jgi:hypothetical protein